MVNKELLKPGQIAIANTSYNNEKYAGLIIEDEDGKLCFAYIGYIDKFDNCFYWDDLYDFVDDVNIFEIYEVSPTIITEVLRNTDTIESLIKGTVCDDNIKLVAAAKSLTFNGNEYTISNDKYERIKKILEN